MSLNHIFLENEMGPLKGAELCPLMLGTPGFGSPAAEPGTTFGGHIGRVRDMWGRMKATRWCGSGYHLDRDPPDLQGHWGTGRDVVISRAPAVLPALVGGLSGKEPARP